MIITHLSDDELFAHAKSICDERSQLLARLLLVLIEIEERRLHERKACASMFVFCRDRLGMSEPAAFRRSAAAQCAGSLDRRVGQSLARGAKHR